MVINILWIAQKKKEILKEYVNILSAIYWTNYNIAGYFGIHINNVLDMVLKLLFITHIVSVDYYCMYVSFVVTINTTKT